MPGGPEAWELVVMLLVLKLPMVWVGAVVWRAIRADPPGPPTGGDGPGGSRLLPRPPDERSPWQRRPQGRPGAPQRPHAGGSAAGRLGAGGGRRRVLR